MGFEEAILETDCKLLVDHISSPAVVDYPEFGSLVLHCRVLLSLNPTFKVHFVKRHANKVAHGLFRVAATTACSHAFSSIPI